MGEDPVAAKVALFQVKICLCCLGKPLLLVRLGTVQTSTLNPGFPTIGLMCSW